MSRHDTTRTTRLNEGFCAIPSPAPRSSLLRTFGIIVFFLIVGLPAIMVFTHGMALLPLGILVILFPFVAIHYVLWGWWLAPGKEVDQSVNHETSIPRSYYRSSNPEGIQRKDSSFHC